MMKTHCQPTYRSTLQDSLKRRHSRIEYSLDRPVSRRLRQGRGFSPPVIQLIVPNDNPTKNGARAGGMILRCLGCRPTPIAKKSRAVPATNSIAKASRTGTTSRNSQQPPTLKFLFPIPARRNRPPNAPPAVWKPVYSTARGREVSRATNVAIVIVGFR